MAKKKYNRMIMGNKLANDKIKVEGIKRKKRRMKLKAKGNNDAIIEKFSAQSSKSAKYAKTTVKKREGSEAKIETTPVVGKKETQETVPGQTNFATSANAAANWYDIDDTRDTEENDERRRSCWWKGTNLKNRD